MKDLPDRLPLILSGWHVVLFLVTALFGEKIASGGNPLFCVDLPVSLPLVGRDDAATVIVVGALATAWWYFVGQIGLAARRGKDESYDGAGRRASIAFASGRRLVRDD
jgi:hypothetical protein